MRSVLACGLSDSQLWPAREGEIFWSYCPTPPVHLRVSKRNSCNTQADEITNVEWQGQPVAAITQEMLEDWIGDTVGWRSIEITADALRSAGAHLTHAKALIQASMEAAAKVNARRCRVTQVDIDQTMGRCLGTGLCAYPNIEVLALRELNVYDESVLSLGAGVREAEGLKKLSLKQVDISVSGWAALWEGLQGSVSVEIIKVRQCLSSFSVAPLAAAIPGFHASLTHLDLSSNNMGDRGLAKLCEGLIRNHFISHLNLSDNNFGAPSASSQSISHQGRGNSVTGALIAELLLRHKGILHLELGMNPALGPSGCLEVTKALPSAPNLEYLGLRRCGADDEAVDLCCRALQAGHNLAHLDLGGGKVTSIGAQMLAAVCHKGKLKHLSLRGSCMVGTDGGASFSRALVCKSCPLQHLDLADCEAGDEAAVALASALMEGRQGHRDSPSLSRQGQTGPLSLLDLSSNQITVKGISALVSSLRYNRGLRSLDISFNWVGPKALKSCLDSLKQKQPATGVGGVTGSGLSMCVIKAEVGEEFRQIERIKAGDWKACNVVDDDGRGGSHAHGGHNLGLAGNAFVLDNGVSPHSENPWAPASIIESNNGLREGQQVPKGITPGWPSTSSSQAGSFCGGSYSSCQRQNNSLSSSRISSLEEDHASVQEAPAASESSITLHHAQPPAGHPDQSSFNRLVAGVTWSSGGGPKSRRLQRELDGCDSLIDGSCNLKLPVSFPAQATISSAYSGHTEDSHEASNNPFSTKMYLEYKSMVTQALMPDPAAPAADEDNPFAPP